MSGYGSRYWADRTAENRRKSHPRFRHDQSADVVVIGGGLAGCAAAYGLSAAGFDVVLIEADRIASGATAGGLGVLLPEPDASYPEAERTAGRRAAKAAWRAAHRGAKE